MYNGMLSLIYGDSEEAQQWREDRDRRWAQAQEEEQQRTEEAIREYEYQQEQELNNALYHLTGIVYDYLIDDINEAQAQDLMYQLGFNPSDLERFALEMIDTMER